MRISCMIVRLNFRAKLPQETPPQRVHINILLLDRLRYTVCDIMQQEELMLNSILISGPYDNRLDEERKEIEMT